MPRASRSKLPDTTIQEFTTHFAYLLTSLTQNDDLDVFFSEFLTKEEKIMLSKRLILFMLIHRGYTPSVIHTALHISPETIRTYVNQFPTKGEVFHRYIEKLSKHQQTQDFFKKVDLLFKPVDLFLQSKSNMKARAKLLNRDWS